MTALDSEIEHVETILKRLRYNRSALQHLSDRHHNVLNPTRRLPVEILGEIFVQLQEMLGGRSITPTQICRHWREVAIGTSRLWNCIKVSHHSGRQARDTEMVTLWLQRSGGQPLNIMLGRDSPSNQRERENPALNVVLSDQAHRWKEMELHINDAMASFLKKIPDNLPILDTLYISGRPHGVTPFANFKNAPALRSLILDGRLSSSMPIFPWAQLTKCSLLRKGGYTCQDGYHVLSQASSLQAYKMELRTSAMASDVHPLPTICLNHLLSLDIEIIAGRDMWQLLDSLTLPALTDLRVVEMLQSDLPEHTVTMINRSHCILKRLSIGSRHVAFTHDQLLNIFTLTHMLTELELMFDGGAGLDETLLDLMTHYPDHAAESCCLLPQLASIKLHINNCLSYERFVDFLCTRFDNIPCKSGAIAQICTAVLVIWDDTTASGRRAYHLPDETYKDFLELRDGGLDLYVEGTRRLTLEEYFVPGEEEEDSEEEGDDPEHSGYNEELYMW
ncbi:hypothetical protein HWV62_18606 [Athelia sp. TMB]|nr:hypothetical protein HWV62_18606 [Athelia sp. TMB]